MLPRSALSSIYHTHMHRRHRKLAPPLPPRPKASAHPTSPLKTLQGIKTKRPDSTHPGYGRNVVFVTRKVSLGALMGRCKGLLVDEGFKSITIHAMAAAIPHALLLLHALLDLLPFSQRALWYEIKTSSTECTDEVEAETSIGAVEEDAPTIEKRIKSTIQIDLHVGARPRPPVVEPGGKKHRARLGKRAREALRAKAQGGASVGEEEMFNDVAKAQGTDGMSEEEEEIEEVEER